ncbi:hypothetical protein [Actinomadura sp. 7K507]|nr:hypothetical protein [Actinomadura sp. 7K507]
MKPATTGPEGDLGPGEARGGGAGPGPVGELVPEGRAAVIMMRA